MYLPWGNATCPTRQNSWHSCGLLVMLRITVGLRAAATCGRRRSLLTVRPARATGKQPATVQLSILIPTHRDDLLACSRIAQACSCARPDVEVIVRDNSGSAQKREFLAHVRRDNCNIIIAEPCDGLKNFSEVLRLAKGEFVFLLADDDFCFERTIAALPGLIRGLGNDRSVAGITGSYVVETSRGSAIVGYKDIDFDDVSARVAGYLGYNLANVMHYAPIRRELIQRIFAFMNTLPFYFSFHDQIICLLYLLSGKFVRLPRLLYLYDFGVWEVFETAQKRDVDFYDEAGLDPAINKLHWFLCGFEGAALILNSDVFPDFPRPKRQAIADRWFAAMFGRFRGHPRATFGSSLGGEAEKLYASLCTSTGALSFQGMLAEVCRFMGLASESQAQTYFKYWDAVLNRRQPALRPTGS